MSSYKTVFFVVIALLAASVCSAAPVVFCSDGGINLVTQGCISGDAPGYDPDHDGFYNNAGGGDSEAKVEQSIFLATGLNIDITQYGKSDTNASLFTFNPIIPNGTSSGTWTVNDGTLIRFITIKAANSYALYDVGNVSTGSYSTEGLLSSGGQQPGVSHISFWTVPGSTVEEVPEPGTIGMLAAGLGVLALRLRRRA